jgi:VWFA-related protein
MRLGPLVVTCALVAGALTAIGGAQAPAQPPAEQQPTAEQQPQQPVFRTGINFVRVDVIVTDNKGNSVADLQAEDFEVVEDGTTQKIEAFKLIKLDGGVAEAAKEVPRAIRTDFDEEAEAARDDVRLFGIFLDDYHVRLGSSMAVREPLANFVLTQLGPSDMVGLMYPLESLGTVRMTRNREAIARGIQQFRGRKYEYTPRNEYEQRYFQYPTEIVERIRNQVSMSAIRALIIHMGSLKEGRKALILVSEGFTSMLPPQLRDQSAAMPGFGNPDANDPLAGVNNPNEDRALWASGLDLDHELRNIYDDANKNNVAIYALDPRGLAAAEFDISDNVSGAVDSKYLMQTLDSLRMLAENSDGRALINSNELSAGLAQVVRDTSAYYLLGYSSTEAPSDGKFHEIKVRVKRPGVQVRARRGYWALTAEETARVLAPPKAGPAKEVTDALATVSAPVRSSRVVRTWIGTTRGGNGKTRVTFIWEPLPKTPGSRVSDTPARVSLMAVGADGSPHFRGRVPEALSASAGPASASASAPRTTAGGATARQGGSRVTFEVPPGTIQLRLSVEDASSQVLDSEVREITVPDLSSPQTLIGTPAIHRARTVREFEDLKSDFDALPVATREFSRTDRLLVRVPLYGPGDTTPTVTAKILNRTGEAIFDLPIVTPPTPTTPAQIELLLTRIPPGEYLVEIKASGEGGEAKELVGFRITG